MSIRVMSQVWATAQASGGKLLVLLALADFADDNGICWPAVSTLAKKARLSERQTQSVLHELAAESIILIARNRGQHGANRYRIVAGGANTAPVQSATKGVKPTAPKPSKESPIQAGSKKERIDWLKARYENGKTK